MRAARAVSRSALLLALSFPCLAAIAASAEDRKDAAFLPFAEALVRFEQNATDGDVEVVFEAKGGDDGLAMLRVTSPDGRTVVDFEAPDPSTLGIRQFAFESPEPADHAGLKRAYPEGLYRFSGATASGTRFHAEARLSHALPVTASILRPEAGLAVPVDLELAWAPLENLRSVLVEIEQDELGIRLSARLPGSATSFPLPRGFLVPGREYKLALGTVTREGNVSFVETSFKTVD